MLVMFAPKAQQKRKTSELGKQIKDDVVKEEVKVESKQPEE